MISRAGNVIYWAASSVAGIAALIGVFAAVTQAGADQIAIPAIFGLGAVLVWIIGRASLYVLAGK